MTAGDPAGTWLTVPQAVKWLRDAGYPRASGTVRSWIRRGHLPVTRGEYQGCARLLVREADLLAAEATVWARTKPAQRAPLAIP